jgi:type I restriction enzyme S subunit
MRPYLNKVWVAQFEGICSAEFIVLRHQPELDNQFLALRLNAEDFVTFANGEISGERPRVDFERLAIFPILLPPLTEQKRIVSKLLAALSEIELAERATARAQERLKRYRIAVLEAAVMGELTKDWRVQQMNKSVELQSGEALLQHLLAGRRATWEETELEGFRASGKYPTTDNWKARYMEPVPPSEIELPRLPRTWTWATVGQITTNVATGATPYRGNPAYWDGGEIPWVTSSAVNDDVITTADEFITELAISETNAKVFPAGTLLVALYGEGKTRGMVADKQCSKR